MNDARSRLEAEVLDGYASGPDAPIAATAAALGKMEFARSVILVEGISDQIALEAASRLGRDLETEAVIIVPIGGAQAATRFLQRLGPGGEDLPISGLCDVGEEEFFRQGLAAAGIGEPRDRMEMEEFGVFVCIADLEDELIRAAGRELIESVLDSQGDLGSFRTIQKQPAWRSEPFDAQMHRWLRAGGRRNLRYARLLILALDADEIPQPLVAVVARTSAGA